MKVKSEIRLMIAPQLIDTHCHIDGSKFSEDRAEVIERAFEAGVSRMIVVGMSDPGFAPAVELAEKHEQIFASVGIHPHDADGATEEHFVQIEEYASHGKVVAIGEMGLDYYRDRSDREKQLVIFRRQLALAWSLGKPVIFHLRDKDGSKLAYDHALAIVSEIPPPRDMPRPVGVLHCYGGDAEFARAMIKKGFLVSFSGSLTFPRFMDHYREVVRAVGIDNLLVETDCPYIAPVPHRGKRNEPAFVTETARKVAEFLGLSDEDVARITTRNAERLFRLPARGAKQRTITYRIRDSLYINLTNRCNAGCVFCPRETEPVVKGHDLGMREDDEPTAEEVIAEIDSEFARRKFSEIVFCGFGEPTLRLPELIEVGTKARAKGFKVRLNTNGWANWYHGRNVLPEIAPALDVISISLNTQDPEQYAKIMRPRYDEGGEWLSSDDPFEKLIEFVREAKLHVETVVLTALDGFPGVVDAECEAIAKNLGVNYRDRVYKELG
ncbi:MAG: YchF/TatD family DNA exonuclease [Planctomycetes bacterium]|nr:YchF/TatD family DNA exonuclease [Planctomycetota bacterium]